MTAEFVNRRLRTNFASYWHSLSAAEQETKVELHVAYRYNRFPAVDVVITDSVQLAVETVAVDDRRS